jgi:acylphosphatase
MQLKHSPSRPNPTKDQLKINLSGDYSGKVNIIFEVYRQAVGLGLMGYAKKLNDTHTEIMVAGETDAVVEFQDWLKTRISDINIQIITENPQVLIDYREFRIIH